MTIPQAIETTAPPHSRIAGQLSGAYFHDAWCVEATGQQMPALGHFLAAVSRTPRWIDACMGLRNRVVALLGLKNLGRLSAISKDKPAMAYQPGERVGIFTLFENGFDEALLGDRDKHLNVVLSVHRSPVPDSDGVRVTVTTVVHVNNWLGRVYMWPVRPMHRLIAPAVLRSIGLPKP